MKILLRPFVFAVLLAASTYGAYYGSLGWNEAFVNDRIFTSLLGWIDLGALISWSFLFIFFFALGLFFTSLFGSQYSGWWTAALGTAYGLSFFHHSNNYFLSNANWATYFFAYGTYFVPTLGALSGTFVASILLRNNAKRVDI